MPGEERTRVLDAMEPDDADELRRLLSYGEETAGGLMNTYPVVLGPHATVAEALARIRDPELAVALAAQVYVTQPPWDTPTGTYLGVVHFQRLLREPPGMELGKCIEDEPPVAVDLPDTEVAVRLASYNLVSVAVCNAERQPARNRHRRRRARSVAARRVAAADPGDSGMKRREDLSTPRQGPSLGVHYDPEAFGDFSEAIARTLGTARFLVIQTVVVVVWIILNVIGWLGKWDPYPFILLNLAFSTQAAYAAPLILLAQNRQADRDRVQQEQDRLVNERVQADTEFLAREIATVRLSLSDVVTSEDLNDAVDQLKSAIERLGSSKPAG